MENPDNELPYHLPVMLTECLDALIYKNDGIYADVTFGGGGHSRKILERLVGGRLFGIDQDADAEVQSAEIKDPAFTFIRANFRNAHKFLRLNGVKQIDGVLADLGISSHQIDEGSRGFSTRFEGELDMRMDQTQDLHAATVLNTYEREELSRIFRTYGEIPNAWPLAKLIASERIHSPFETTADVCRIARKIAPRGKEFRYFAQVFQAIRMEVNDELGVLKEFLLSLPAMIKPGGRAVFLTYHSLEDRLVKNFFQEGLLEGTAEKDLYGNSYKPFKQLYRKPLIASPEEVLSNPRARSAKLRAAVRLDEE